MKRSDVMAIIADKEKPDKEIVQAIMDLHKVDAELWKTVESELRGDLADALKPPEGAEDWQQRYNDEVTAHKATRDGYAAEKDAADTDGKISALLKTAGMNAAAIPKALKLYDRKIVERGKDGEVSNSDKVLEFFKGEWSEFFGTTETKGADIGTPPPPSGTSDPFLEGFNSK